MRRSDGASRRGVREESGSDNDNGDKEEDYGNSLSCLKTKSPKLWRPRPLPAKAFVCPAVLVWSDGGRALGYGTDCSLGSELQGLPEIPGDDHRPILRQ